MRDELFEKVIEVMLGKDKDLKNDIAVTVEYDNIGIICVISVRDLTRDNCDRVYSYLILLNKVNKRRNGIFISKLANNIAENSESANLTDEYGIKRTEDILTIIKNTIEEKVLKTDDDKLRCKYNMLLKEIDKFLEGEWNNEFYI